MIVLPKLSLYIHIPWCSKKCPYCDFNSYVSKKNIPEKKYVENLIKDFHNDKKFIQNRKIQTIFIGGGTPNLLSNNSIKNLIENIKNSSEINKLTEITIEVNPESINIEKILEYINIGINRISIGIQSFNQKSLKLLGRNHTEEISTNLLHAIKKNRINSNIDLIYGTPEQTLQDCLNDLKKAIFMDPTHISWYQLSIEKNTPFYFEKLNLPNEETIWKMYNIGDKLLKQSKYKRYEISSYSKPNFECLHNLNYWHFGDYIGIGCGAHSKITHTNGNITRFIKKKNIYHYLSSNKYIQKKYKVLNQEKPFEYFLNTFRLFHPIKKKYFSLYTGLSIKKIQKQINQCIQEKYITETNKYWIVLPKGRNFLNNLLELFIEY
ncbi:radical SAM family heme chaperone HemW [Buchnera aphidicola]|uniref:radical SAM family heme chaperone HemW n=1 Tax=Buchnera aphidicola TaxID=9 RepID=UPI0034642DF1